VAENSYIVSRYTASPPAVSLSTDIDLPKKEPQTVVSTDLNIHQKHRVFLDVDTQRDFLEPSGALYVPGSAAIIANLARLTEFALQNRIPIVATACAHLPDDPELSRFPPHCMAGTPGQGRVRATSFVDSVVLDVDERLDGDLPRHLTLLKRELDVFSRLDADELLRRYNRDQPTFVVYGVATDYCVRAAVEGLLNRNVCLTIVTDAIRAIDPSTEADLLTDWAKRGADLTVTDVVCRINVT
jgi:nicotinamidase/pyrazinamidase